MGSGKSSVGKVLAAKLKLKYVDLDKQIETKTQKTIAQLFESQGEKGFRILEKRVLREICNLKNCVIALGGGTPCFHNNIFLINKSGISIFLDAGIGVLLSRLEKEKTKRPLINPLTKNKLRSFVQTHLKERRPYYMKSLYRIKVKNNEDINTIANKIFEQLDSEELTG